MDDFHGELVPQDVTRAELLDEAHFRARQAGYPVTREGKAEPRRIMTTVSRGATRLNVWPRDAHGNLIGD